MSGPEAWDGGDLLKAAGAEWLDPAASRAGMGGLGSGGDAREGFVWEDAPCFMKRARTSRYNPDLNEPGGGSRDSSGGRLGEDSGATERGSPH